MKRGLELEKWRSAILSTFIATAAFIIIFALTCFFAKSIASSVELGDPGFIPDLRTWSYTLNLWCYNGWTTLKVAMTTSCCLGMSLFLRKKNRWLSRMSLVMAISYQLVSLTVIAKVLCWGIFREGGWLFNVLWIMPHGLFEIPGALLGTSIFIQFTRENDQLKLPQLTRLGVLHMGLLLMAALTESYFPHEGLIEIFYHRGWL